MQAILGGGYRTFITAGRATEGAPEAQVDDESEDDEEGRVGAFSVSHLVGKKQDESNLNSAEGAGPNLQHGMTARERQQQMMLMGS